MSIIAVTLPTLGDPVATEDPDTRNTLQTLITDYNGQISIDNFASSVKDAMMPWTIDIDPFTTAATNTGFTIIVNANQIKNGFSSSTGTQNDVMGWDVALSAGTWTLNILISTSTTQGIYTAALDGSSVGTMDGYAASTNYNVSKSITGISVTTTGKKRLTLTMATKNASASSYQGALTAVRLIRTA